MREAHVVVLGGYGALGSRCARELVEATAARVIVAGPSAQRAEQAAMSCGERARGAYADAADRRTLARVLEGAQAVVVCSGGDWTPVLASALELRVPVVGASTLVLDERAERLLAERAWQAQVPVVLHAGAVPGLCGLLAEWLVRRQRQIDALRVASTGAWEETATARRDVAAARARQAPPAGWNAGRRVAPRALPPRFEFAEPIGTRGMRAARAADLERFPETHVVGSFVYLEPDPGPIVRGLGRVLGLAPPPGFAVAAEAWARNEATPRDWIAVQAPDALAAAAPALGVLVGALLAGRIPGGLWTPREALNPHSALDAMAKRGLRVTTRQPS
jgi:NAD(P)-dependent dehydrogenase (short-subunit alcohol dehydrogenase family)